MSACDELLYERSPLLDPDRDAAPEVRVRAEAYIERRLAEEATR